MVAPNLLFFSQESQEDNLVDSVDSRCYDCLQLTPLTAVALDLLSGRQMNKLVGKWKDVILLRCYLRKMCSIAINILYLYLD